MARREGIQVVLWRPISQHPGNGHERMCGAGAGSGEMRWAQPALAWERQRGGGEREITTVGGMLDGSAISPSSRLSAATAASIARSHSLIPIKLRDVDN